MEDWEQCSAARYRSWKNKGKARIVPETWENKPIVSQFEIEQWVWVFVMK